MDSNLLSAPLADLFDLSGSNAIVTGGCGVLGRVFGSALATYGESGQSEFQYRTWNTVDGWSAGQTGPTIGAITNSMTLDSDPATDSIMLSIQDANNDLHFIHWDGADWGGDNELATDTGETKNQPFVFLWNQDGSLLNNAPVLAGASDLTSIDEAPAIPADFFGPGSHAFVGLVCFDGVPLGNTEYGEYAEADGVAVAREGL